MSRLEVVSQKIHEKRVKKKLQNFCQACKNGDVNIVKEMIVDKDIDINGFYEDKSPLQYGIIANAYQLVQFLINEGNANVNVASPLSLWTPFHYACDKNLFYMVEILLENNVDTNMKNAAGILPIDLAKNLKLKSMIDEYEQKKREDVEKEESEKEEEEEGESEYEDEGESESEYEDEGEEEEVEVDKNVILSNIALSKPPRGKPLVKRKLSMTVNLDVTSLIAEKHGLIQDFREQKRQEFEDDQDEVDEEYAKAKYSNRKLSKMVIKLKKDTKKLKKRTRFLEKQCEIDSKIFECLVKKINFLEKMK